MRVVCPVCDRAYNAASELAGRTTPCLSCGTPITLSVASPKPALVGNGSGGSPPLRAAPTRRPRRERALFVSALQGVWLSATLFRASLIGTMLLTFYQLFWWIPLVGFALFWPATIAVYATPVLAVVSLLVGIASRLACYDVPGRALTYGLLSASWVFAIVGIGTFAIMLNLEVFDSFEELDIDRDLKSMLVVMGMVAFASLPMLVEEFIFVFFLVAVARIYRLVEVETKGKHVLLSGLVTWTFLVGLYAVTGLLGSKVEPFWAVILIGAQQTATLFYLNVYCDFLRDLSGYVGVRELSRQ